MSDYSTGGKFEKESRISHTYIINDEEVKEYLNNCTIPAHAKNVDLNHSLQHDITYPDSSSIETEPQNECSAHPAHKTT